MAKYTPQQIANYFIYMHKQEGKRLDFMKLLKLVYISYAWYLNKGGQGDRIYSAEAKSVCLSANGGGRGTNTGLYKIDLPDGDYNIRKLAVNECCRLQGFPDFFVDSISKSQGYKALGNSFTVPVIEHILKTILK